MRRIQNPRSLAVAMLGLPDDVRLIWGLCKDRRVSLWSKVFLGAGLAYIVSPVDVIPDVIPGLGRLDDLAVAILLVRAFERTCPSAIVHEHRTKISRGMADLDRDLNRLTRAVRRSISNTLNVVVRC